MTTSSTSPLFWTTLAKGAGLASAAVGFAVLIGWLLDSALLKSIHPSLVAMKANTAVGFGLAGGALYLKSIPHAASLAVWRRIGQISAGTVALLGLLTLVEYISGASLGIDQLLFQEPPGAIGTLAPGRMAPASALCFLSIGVALLVNGESRQGNRLVFALVVLVALLALTGGLSFLYGAPRLSGLGYYTQMAAHTVVVFLVLAAGILCLTPHRGVVALLRSPGPTGMVSRHLLPAAIILQIVLEYLNQAGTRAGLVEAQFGVVLVDVVNILMFAIVIIWVARSISRVDSQRQQAEAVARAAQAESLRLLAESDRARLELQGSESRFRALIENASDITVVVGAVGQIEYVSPSVTRIAGYQPNELVGKDMFTLIHPDDQLVVSNNLTMIGAADPETIRLVEGRYRQKDGTWRTAETLIRNLLADPAIAGIVINVRDITERKQAEESLRLADRVFHSTVEGIVVTDPDAIIVAVNPAFEAITGYTQAEVLGKNPRLLQSGRQDQAFYRDLWAGLLATGQWRGELWNRRKDGEVYPEWLTLSTVKNAQGRTTNYVGVFSDISSVKDAQQQIEFLTHHDALSGLPNRALLKDRLNLGMQRAQREGHPLALLYLGLDHFKNLNESLGHAVGDGVLQEVARRLAGATRAGDTLARVGGDEFVLLLEEDVLAQQIFVARKLLELFAAPLLIAGHELAVTASIGISLYPDDATETDALLKNANQAMHNAKAAGRNTYRFFDPALSAGVRERLRMEQALRGALAQNQLLLHYQPQVDLYSGEITGMEALMRWQHPDKGLLAAGEFISLAEETGLIVPIGAWMLAAACRQLQAWHAAGHTRLRMSINVSALQFAHGDLGETLAQVLRDSGLDGRYLELELNESLILSDFDKAQAMLKQFKSLGVGLAIDNFGIGNSIKHFPIDKLKIAKSVVGGIVTDLNDASIAQAIIAMGHGLRMKIVAEGVETEAQAGYLRTLHCDEMQGFHFSRALPAEEIPALLAAHEVLATSPDFGGGRVLLLVDDEANVLSALKRLLRRDGYKILTAASAEEGLELLARHKVGVLLSDQRMPGMNGTELLSRVKVMYPNIIRMILSGYTDVNSITESINRGEVYKFLTKPWEDEPLRAALKEAFMHYESSQYTQPSATPGAV